MAPGRPIPSPKDDRLPRSCYTAQCVLLHITVHAVASNLPLERHLSGLVTKIEEGHCVLVLGPRIAAPREVAGREVSIDDYLAAALIEDLEGPGTEPTDLRHAIARYERDRSAAACRSLVQDLAHQIDGFATELHRDLAALPFSLILTATPDRMMAAALRAGAKQGVKESYYDFSRNVPAAEHLTLPTAVQPIVYSLFGRHDHPESMVLNDRNLLDYLVKITRESPALPDAVRSKLRDPQTVFLFVGFGFSNWWLRLLLKVLDVTGVDNRSISLALEDEITFIAATASEQKGFFEAQGIFIQARDWNALAKELLRRVQPAPAQAAPRSDPLANVPAAADAQAQAHPLVFLSYASEDLERVDALRDVLKRHGIAVWQDKQNLRAGQYWMDQVQRVIEAADYFVFVQTDKMDERKDGVYNEEVLLAFAWAKKLNPGITYLMHVTMGSCRPREQRELTRVHRIAVDSDDGKAQLAQDILVDWRGRADGSVDARDPAVLTSTG